MRQRVTVVGAGVIGLTCAVRLAEAGLEVDVLARDLPLETTSAAGGGLWLPGTADERELAWARAGLAELRAAEGPASGVRVAHGHLLDGIAATRPHWAGRFGDAVRLEPESAPAAGHPLGWRTALPLADPRRYLPWMRDRLTAAGGTLTRLALPMLPARGVVVDAVGVAARALAADPRVHPVRTQVVTLGNPGLEAWWWDLGGSLCVLPFGDVVLVEGAGVADEWTTAPDAAAARQLVQRAGEVVPRLRSAEILGVRVGLRPARGSVRLESQRRPTDEDADHVVVHCYGHGSRGFTLSWGCADEVTRIVVELAGSSAGAPSSSGRVTDG
ncbi:MAG: FAD-dependent oxidoreductase [Kineosporiaceae bacterium]